MAVQKVRIDCIALARHYTLLVIDVESGERVAAPITGIPAWLIIKVREDLFEDWIGSGAAEVSMSAIPELTSLEVAQWKKG
jgi:hypothetical protein